MFFSSKKSNTHLIEIVFNDTKLTQVSHTMFLGIIIDDRLSWKIHITSTCKKISRCIGILGKVSNALSQNILLLLYNAIVLPHLHYGILLWGSTSKSHIDQLFILQKKALKIVFKLPKLTPTVYLFQSKRILTIYQLHDLYCGIFMFKFQNSLLPTCFRNYFTQNVRIHDHQTRNTSDYHIPLFHTSKNQQSIKYVGTKIWLKIPAPMKELLFISTFKFHFKKYLLNSF